MSLSEELPKNTLVIVEFSHFESVIPNNQGLFGQRQQTNWIIGTLFKKIGARTVFPLIDEKENRATLDLCLIHPTDVTSRSNMPVKSSQLMVDLSKTCFVTTPAISSQQYGFVMFENMQQISNNDSIIEVFIGKHLKNHESKWIFNEIETVNFFFENCQ